tara:strand:+ start:275 stop:703 length:429 start_codon:yes stop_codon:yes gene_type:complete
MILISHRGNITGIEKDSENKPDYIFNALNKGFNVEIDIWKHKDDLYLGHDEPNTLLPDKLLENKNNLWFHAKNLDCLIKLHQLNVHYFWHQNDDVTITNKGFWWTYPGKKLYKNSICVLPEKFNQDISICAGCCSDLIGNYK